MACRSRWASHHPSLSSVLCPFRFFTRSGLASCTLTASSNTLNTGFQYDPVLSITTSVTPSCFSQARNRSSSATVAPYLRRSTRGSPVNGPTSTDTARNLFPTSMPAHRSTAAGIIVVSFRAGEPRTSRSISSSAAQLLHSGVLHVHSASFVCGSYRAPLPNPAAFSGRSSRLSPVPFSSPGVACTPGHGCFVSYPDYKDFALGARTLSGLVAQTQVLLAFGARTGEPPELRMALAVTPN